MYYFLCASLPHLVLNGPLPMTVAQFDNLCSDQLTPGDFDALTSSALAVDRRAKADGLYADYIYFEQYLRFKLAQRRAANDLEKLPQMTDPEVYFTVIDADIGRAASAPDMFDREKCVDMIRWRFLDDFTAPSEFDLRFLAGYRLRLAIMQKYQNRLPEPGKANFEAAADKISKTTQDEETK